MGVWDFREINARNLEKLKNASAFTFLQTWFLGVGRDSALSTQTLLELLSIMPSLRNMSIGQVVDLAPRQDVTSLRSVASLAKPACSLERIEVNIGWGFHFSRWSHLVVNSQHTLRHVAAGRMSSPDSGNDLATALGHCADVRRLWLVGNRFDNARLFAACPRLEILGLENIRSLFPQAWAYTIWELDDEIVHTSDEVDIDAGERLLLRKLKETLPPLLRELIFVDYRPGTGDEFVTLCWTESIRYVLPLLPKHRRICIKTMGGLPAVMVPQHAKAYSELRKACTSRRIFLTLIDKNDVS